VAKTDNEARIVELLNAMAGAVQAQLKLAVTAFVARDEKQARKAIEKDDFVDNLYIYTEGELFQMVLKAPPEEIELIRTGLKMAKGLEKIADYAENIAKQTLHMLPGSDKSLSIDILGCYQEAKEGIELAIRGFEHRDIKQVKRAAKKEAILDDVYRVIITRTLEQLQIPGRDAGYLITQLLLAKYLEKIGDTLLDMAEAALQLISGERLKIHQYVHLTRLIKDGNINEAELEGFWGTRSGASVFRLDASGEEQLIYKEGRADKIRQEEQKLKQWEEIEPGLVPHVKHASKVKDRRIMVTQFFDGASLASIYGKPWWYEKETATRALVRLLERIWDKTLKSQRPAFDAFNQLRERLESVYAMHPELEAMRKEKLVFCGRAHPPLGETLNCLEAAASRFRAPFSVFIHGDFNSDNVIFLPESGELRYIDVHRSKSGDYLQDVSVFMVSNIRMPAFSGMQLLEAERVNLMMETFARNFGAQHGDKLFDDRLNLMLARSLITSARFVGDFRQARRLYLAGIDKLERVVRRLEAGKIPEA